jgi:hypothetical protein
VVLAIIAIWAIIIPLVILAVCWDSAKRREARATQAARRARCLLCPGGVPKCAMRPRRPRRTITRRVCPELPRTRRRPASA